MIRQKFVFTIFAMSVGYSTCFATPRMTSDTTSGLTVYLDKLLSIACDKTNTTCVAVGFGKEPKSFQRIVYTTQDAGKTWNGPIALSPVPNETQDISHNAQVSCDAYGQQCVIVSDTSVQNVPAPVAYKTNDGGASWSEPMVLPLPNNTLPPKNSTIYTKVSCNDSGMHCIIAGGLFPGGIIDTNTNRLMRINKNPLLYITKDAGDTWQISNINIPFKFYSNTTSLSSASCDNTGNTCIVVGTGVTNDSFFSDSISDKPVVYTTKNGGKKWSTTILPVEVTDNNASAMIDVACNSTNMQCTAFGVTVDYVNNTKKYFSFSTNNAGASWQEQSDIVSPTDIDRYVEALDCDDTATNCTAVGFIKMANTNVVKPLVYNTTNSGSNWAKNLELSCPAFSYLTDLSCSKVDNSCIAVGVQETIGHDALIEHKKYQFGHNMLPAQLAKSSILSDKLSSKEP